MEKVKNRRILITGGSGFIGYHLASQLSRDPQNFVILVDNFVRGIRDEDFELLLKNKNIKLISADLTKPETFALVGDGYDEVYHLAAILGVQNVLERPHDVLFINAVSTLNLLRWFVKGGGKKLLFSSTSEAYAWTQIFYSLPVPTPENVPLALIDLKNPRSSYAASKIFGELSVTQYCEMHKKYFTIVRFHNVYGPRMGFEHVIPQLYQRALNGQDPLVVYSANHSRAFCYISDAISALIKAMRKDDANGQILNIGNDKEEITIGELAKRILKIAKKNGRINPQIADNDPIVRRCPDISKAKKLLDYTPIVYIDKGLEFTLKWYANRFVS